jgi:hypothetical protein
MLAPPQSLAAAVSGLPSARFLEFNKMAELDPSIILAGKPQPIYDPALLVAKRQALAAGALQNQQRQQALDSGAQGLQIGAQDLQAKTYANQATALQLADQATMSQQLHAMSNPAAAAVAPPAAVATPGAPVGVRVPGGLIDRTGTAVPAAGAIPPAGPAPAGAAPRAGFDYDQYLENIRGKVSPGAYFSAAQMVMGNREKLATLDKTNSETAAAKQKLETERNNYLSGVATNIQKADYSPGSLELGLHMAETMGGPEMAQHVAQIRQLIAANPDNARKIIDAVAAGADAPMVTAQARAVTAASGAQKQGIEAVTQQAAADQATRQNNAVNIASAPDLAAAHRLAFRLPLDQQAPFLAALEKPDWQTAVTRVGLTPDQSVTTKATADRDANTVTNDAAMRQLGAGHLRIAAAELGLRQQTFNATLGSGLDANGKPLSADDRKTLAMRDPTAVAMANYQIPPPNRTSAQGKAQYDKLLAINPDYDGTQFPMRNKTQQDFGPGGATGKAITSTDTALAHLSTLSQAGHAMENGDFKSLNSLANSVGAQIGRKPQNTYDTILSMVAPEISKAVIGGVGGESDRANIQNRFSSSLSDPVREAAIGGAVSLLAARYDKQAEAYKSAMGKDLPRQLSPESQAVRKHYAGGSTAAAPFVNVFRK